MPKEIAAIAATGPTAKSPVASAPAGEATKTPVPVEDIASADPSELANSFRTMLEGELSPRAEEEPKAAESAEPATNQEEPAGDEDEDLETESEKTGEEETEEAPGEEAEETAETEAEDPEKSERKDWPQSAHKRVGKLTKKLSELETQLAEVETIKAENEELKTKLQSPVPRGEPVLAVEQQLEQTIAQKRAVIAWAEENPDGGQVPDGKGGSLELTAAQARQARRQAEEELQDLRLDLKQYRQQVTQVTAQMTQQAQADHPWLLDKTSPKYQRVQKALRDCPMLARIPEHMRLVADAIEMNEIRQQRKTEAAKVKAAPVVKRPVVVAKAPKPGSGAPVVPSRPGVSMDKFLTSGSEEDARQVVESWLS